MKRFGYGADIGGTTTKIGFFQADGTLCEKWEIPTDISDSGARILPDLAAEIRAHRERNRLDGELVGIGVGVPGSVTGGKIVDHSVNLGWGVVDVAKGLGELTGLPVRCGNDANAAALGELWMGGGKGVSSMVFVTLGTGVGGGIVVDGKVIEGVHGAAGEIGHIHVNSNETRPCNCGSYGCLEQYASATGLVRMAKEYLSESALPSPLRAGSELTAKEVWDAAKRGDRAAGEITDRYCEILGIGMAVVAAVCDPEVFVFGGGVSKAGTILLDKTVPYYREYAFPSCKDARFELAKLGNDAGMYGCLYMIL